MLPGSNSSSSLSAPTSEMSRPLAAESQYGETEYNADAEDPSSVYEELKTVDDPAFIPLHRRSLSEVKDVVLSMMMFESNGHVFIYLFYLFTYLKKKKSRRRLRHRVFRLLHQRSGSFFLT